MIKRIKDVFFLNTKNTSYILGITKTGHLEHLHYGRRVEPSENTATLFTRTRFALGNTISYDKENAAVNLEMMPLEMSGYGKGDIREPFIVVSHEDGCRTSDFIFNAAEILDEKSEMRSLPASYGKDVKELRITLLDRSYGDTLTLIYDVFEAEDVITKRAEYKNNKEKEVRLLRLMSSMVDFTESGYDFITFGGAWAREMNESHEIVTNGRSVISSMTGTSSNRANPFTMVARPGTTEEYGDCYGMNLIYSGNHYSCLEASTMGFSRFVTGINPEGFCFKISEGEAFESPEAVMTYSEAGFRRLSKNMHDFVRRHIVRGEWKDALRPVLLNSWEAAYFDINEAKLLKLAKASKEVGIELFVMDDGWFKGRNDDTTSLGDWEYDRKKLPNGVKGLSEKIHDLGLQFGIWVEPEMINEKSDLYKKHPEWVLRHPENHHSEGRNQMILDLTRKDVREYIVQSMSKLFSSANINYVKWDMNRIVSDAYSSELGYDRQGEVYHRYVMGLYEVVKTLTEKYPRILFEGCASGGCRFDLGMLCYMSQIWASDNTDAISRATIQTGYSYGYPQSVMGCHVSACPNHQTLRNAPLETRFAVAAYGVLGYELNICELKKEELEAVKDQIVFYKLHRELFQYGDFYRIEKGERTAFSNNAFKWMVANEDGGIGMYLQGLAIPHNPFGSFKAVGLEPGKVYNFRNRRLKYNIKEFGDLINTVAPIHIKRDGVLHNLAAKVVKMDNEKEEALLPGDILMNVGVRLCDGYTGTGYSEDVRLFRDFEARLYTMF